MPALLSRLPWRILLYAGLSGVVTWPLLPRLGQEVPGADRTDLWNALWSMWQVWRAVADGASPLRVDLLDPPRGGSLLVADPLGALLGLPLVPVLGLPATYGLLVLAHVTLAGWAAHRLTGEVARARGLPAEWAGLVGGVAYATAPVLRAAIHNGTSEGVGTDLAALAAWACYRAARDGGAGRVALAGLALALAALGSWYGAVVAFLFAGALALVGLPGGWRRTLGARASGLALGLVLVLPLAAATQSLATSPDNLVRIKHPRELMTVRRSTGPADPRGFLVGGDFRSPDFREISRYGEQFFHCHYLGWVLLAGAGLSLRQRRGTGWLWLAGGAGLLLSMGPVVVRDGAAWIVLQDRAVPLPYLLLERLPGFSGLSLLYRLAQAPSLALSVLAGLGFAGLPRPRAAAVAAVGLVLAEGRWICPLGSLPDTTDARPAPALLALSEAPRGVVLNHPVVGGRAYLYEQTLHGQPMAGTLNFPNNALGMRAWRGLIEAAAQVGAPADGSPPDPAVLDAFRQAASARARAAGARYVVVHDDPWARPDMQDDAVKWIEQAFQPLGPPPGDRAPVRVYALW
ncbi:hypothetical protein L6R53_19040 [Myxococcota bacterium]|nr:hypothetical protein [Myxococcota bacterium]